MIRSRPGLLITFCKQLASLQPSPAPIQHVCSTLQLGNSSPTFQSVSQRLCWSNSPLAASFTSTSTSHASITPDWYVRLNNIADNQGATKTPRRVGRGTGGGRGKTCGKGHKGQKARKGNKPHLLFDGGNETLRKLPKHGKSPSNPVMYSYVNLGRLAQWIERLRLDPSHLITMKDLRDSGCARKRIRWGVKLLSRGAQLLKMPIHVQVSACSASAREAVEKLGGSVTTAYYTPLGLRALLKPERFADKGRDLPRPVRSPAPRHAGKHDIIGAIPPARELPQAAAATA